MKMTKKRVLLVASAAMIASTHAAIISFSSTYDAGDKANLDIQYNAGGSLVEAGNIGDGTSHTVATPGGQSIVFTAIPSSLGDADMPAAASSTSGFYNGGSQWNASIFSSGTSGDGQWDDTLRGNAWHNNGSDATRPLTLRLGNLTIGQEYSVSLFAVDQRTGDSQTRTQAYWSDFSSGFSGGSSASFSTTNAVMVMGTFTADAVYQDIFVQATDAVGNADTSLAAYSLYAIPEPATIGLIGVFGAGMLFVRRRLML